MTDPLPSAHRQVGDSGHVSDHNLLAQALADLQSGAFAGAWSQASPLGSSYRAATDLLMSAYDTNPAATDHTAAFNSALTAASALVTSGYAKVRIILDSRRKYTLGGAVQSGANGQYAQVPLPFHDDTATGTIELVGIPRGNDYTYISAGASGTVIESTLAAAPAFSAANGIASIFGGPASFRTTPGTYPSEFSYLKFATQDITIRSASPVVAGIDAGWITGFSWEGLLSFDTDFLSTCGINYSGMTPCTAPQAIPIIFPFNLDWFGTVGDHLVCAGWTHGPMLGEYLQARSVTVFGATGAALLLDASDQPSRIDFLTDWNNANGIATIDGTFASNAVVSPGSGVQTGTAPGSKRAYKASGTGVLMASPVDIGTWEMQTSQNGGLPAATRRNWDIMDQYALMQVDCPSFVQTDDAGNALTANLNIMGNGGVSNGYVTGIRCKNKMSPIGPNFLGAPASGTNIRNPYGRDCLVQIASLNGGAVSGLSVNTAGVIGSGQPDMCVLPAQGILSVTWATAAPTLVLTAI